MILGHCRGEEERGGQLVTWSIVVTVLRCGRGTRTRLGAPGPMQWIVGAASVVAAAWRAVAPREVTAASSRSRGVLAPGTGGATSRLSTKQPMVVATSRRELNTAPLGPSTLHTSEESSVRLGHSQLGQRGIMGRHLVWISFPQKPRLRI